MSLNLKTKLNYLATGYIREVFMLNNQHHFPSELIQVHIKFIGFSIFMCFDQCLPKFKHEIINDGLEIKRDGTSLGMNSDTSQILFGCSKGFNFGIHHWKIKTFTPSADGIGIASNLDPLTNRKVWIHNVLRGHNATFYYGGGGLYGTGGTFNKKIPRWGKGDIISIILNCEQWTVKFLKNNKLIGKQLKIPPDVEYHLIISSQHVGQRYILLS